MAILQDKKILLTGLLSNRSIAFGIGKALKREGATLAFTYAGEGMRERVEKLAPELGGGLIMSMDVTKQDEIDGVFSKLGSEWGGVDGVVHSIGYAPRDAITGDFLDGLSRSSFMTAMDISAYSFAALGKAARPLMKGRNGAAFAKFFSSVEKPAMPDAASVLIGPALMPFTRVPSGPRVAAM